MVCEVYINKTSQKPRLTPCTWRTESLGAISLFSNLICKGFSACRVGGRQSLSWQCFPHPLAPKWSILSLGPCVAPPPLLVDLGAHLHHGAAPGLSFVQGPVPAGPLAAQLARVPGHPEVYVET